MIKVIAKRNADLSRERPMVAPHFRLVLKLP